jgi:hypothetical protein
VGALREVTPPQYAYVIDDLFENMVQSLYQNLSTFRALASGRTPLVSPPEKEGQEWKSLSGCLVINTAGQVVATATCFSCSLGQRKYPSRYLNSRISLQVQYESPS